MNAFPDIRIPSAIHPTRIRKTVSATADDGPAVTRPQWTSSKMKFELVWDAIGNDDYETLDTFFDANAGQVFTWANPISGAEYVVRFLDDELSPQFLARGFDAPIWSLRTVLMEV